MHSEAIMDALNTRCGMKLDAALCRRDNLHTASLLAQRRSGGLGAFIGMPADAIIAVESAIERHPPDAAAQPYLEDRAGGIHRIAVTQRPSWRSPLAATIGRLCRERRRLRLPDQA